MPDIDQAAETARFWVSWGQAAGLVGVTAAATAIGAAIASKAIDNVDAAAYEQMKADNQRRRRLTVEEAEQLMKQQDRQQRERLDDKE